MCIRDRQLPALPSGHASAVWACRGAQTPSMWAGQCASGVRCCAAHRGRPRAPSVRRSGAAVVALWLVRG
eukprot:5726734-Alexandrium_andersonii.AAC.1